MSREGPPARPGSNGSNPGGDVSETGSQNGQLDDGAKQTIRDLVGIMNDLQARVDHLEDEVEQSDEKIADRVQHRIEDELDEHLKNEQIERTKMLSRQEGKLMDEIEDVREGLRSEQQTRTRADAQTNARISHLADQADVTLDEEEITKHDKLIRAVRNGAEDVTTTPNKREQRARTMLVNLADWGTIRNDSNGKRCALRAKDVKPPLSERYDVNTTTTMVKRSFDVIADWADSSPRRVRKRKNSNDEWTLTIYKPDQLLAAAEEVSN